MKYEEALKNIIEKSTELNEYQHANVQSKEVFDARSKILNEMIEEIDTALICWPNDASLLSLKGRVLNSMRIMQFAKDLNVVTQ